MITFFSNDNCNCNTILSLEGIYVLTITSAMDQNMSHFLCKWWAWLTAKVSICNINENSLQVYSQVSGKFKKIES